MFLSVKVQFPFGSAAFVVTGRQLIGGERSVADSRMYGKLRLPVKWRVNCWLFMVATRVGEAGMISTAGNPANGDVQPVVPGK